MDSKKIFKKAFLPITVLFVPHNNLKRFSFKIPLLGILLFSICFLGIFIYLISIAIQTKGYLQTEEKLLYYQKQFEELKDSIHAIKKAESEFKEILLPRNKERILRNSAIPLSGSVNLDLLREQIKPTVETVIKIKKFLHLQKNKYLATPHGLPVIGKISSPFGMRENPFTGEEEFHPALDIQGPPGTPVKATADGVVSFAGWAKGSGNLVAVEHGFGYVTYYAHNRSLAVKAGQRITKGEVVAFLGATGSTTGPHTHYEVRKNGHPVDPRWFLEKER